MGAAVRLLSLLLCGICLAAEVKLDAPFDEELEAAQKGAERFVKPLLSMFSPSATSLQPFLSGAITSFFIIIVSEIGDKTFFIAALLAMKRGALVTFSGAATALAFMTVLSAFVGRALPALLDPHVTRLASIALFVFFGLKLLWEGFRMESTDEPSELAEVEQTLAMTVEDKKEKDLEDGRMNVIEDSPTKLSCVKSTSVIFALLRKFATYPMLIVSGAFVEAFTLTMAAEWGDRSQIATFALGASKNIWGVNLGAILGHLTCTAMAVLGGKVLASRISERVVAFAGGSTFLFFALAGWIWDRRHLAAT